MRRAFSVGLREARPSRSGSDGVPVILYVETNFLMSVAMGRDARVRLAVDCPQNFQRPRRRGSDIFFLRRHQHREHPSRLPPMLDAAPAPADCGCDNRQQGTGFGCGGVCLFELLEVKSASRVSPFRQSDEVGNRVMGNATHLTQDLDRLKRYAPVFILQCPSKKRQRQIVPLTDFPRRFRGRHAKGQHTVHVNGHDKCANNGRHGEVRLGSAARERM